MRALNYSLVQTTNSRSSWGWVDTGELTSSPSLQHPGSCISRLRVGSLGSEGEGVLETRWSEAIQ